MTWQGDWNEQNDPRWSPLDYPPVVTYPDSRTLFSSWIDAC